MSQKNHFKDRAPFCNFQAFCGKFDLVRYTQRDPNFVWLRGGVAYDIFMGKEL